MNSTLNKIKRRIEKGWDIHARDEYALRDACKNGNLPLVQLLVDEHSADIHVLDNAPLKMACENNHDAIVHFLLERGANPRGMALRACGKKNFELAKLFVAFGDPLLSQALDITCRFTKGNLEMVKFLLERGAMFSVPNLHNAISNNRELVKLILAVGGVVPTPCALALAIKQCKDENTKRFEIVRLLVENLDIPCHNSCDECTQKVVGFLAECGIHDVCKSQSVEDVSWWLSSTYVQKVMKFFIEQRGNEWIQRVGAVELCNASTISEIGFWNMT